MKLSVEAGIVYVFVYVLLLSDLRSVRRPQRGVRIVILHALTQQLILGNINDGNEPRTAPLIISIPSLIRCELTNP